MADNFGLKIGVEGEKEFKNALRDINQSFKVLGSEMKLVESEFGKQDKSIGSLTAKNQVLNKEIDTQKDKISTLERALTNASESFGENDRRTQAWVIQLNNAKAELNNMTSELDENEKALEELSDEFKEGEKSAEDFADSVKKSADESEQSSSKFEKLGGVLKGLGTAFVASVAAIGTAAVSAGKQLYDIADAAADSADNIDKQSQRLGMSKQTFQEWDYILSQNGVSIDTMNTAMKSMTASMDSLAEGGAKGQETLGKLGISVEDLKSKSQEDIFEQAVISLQKMPEGYEKARLAQELFGKQGQEMLPMLNQSKGSIEELKAKAHELGMVMSDDAVMAGVAFRDSLDTLQRSFTGFKNSVGAEMLPGLTMITDGLTGVINGQEGASEKISEGATLIVQSITDVLPKLLEVLGSIVEGISAVAPQIINSLITGIVDNLPMLIDVAINIVFTLLEALISALPQITEGALQLVLALVTGILENLPKLIEAALEMVLALALGIVDALPELIPAIIQTVVKIVEVLLGNMDKIIEGAFKIIVGLAEGLLQALPELIRALPQIIESFVNFFINNLPTIIELGIKINLELAKGIIKAIPQLVSQLPQIITSIVKGLTSGISQISSVGKSMVEGLWEGIKSMKSWITSKVQDFFGGIVSGVKSMLKINSPSKVFAEIGGFMGEGVGVGFVDAMNNVERDMQKAIPTTFDVNTSLNTVNTSETKSFGGGYSNQPFTLKIENFINNRSQDVEQLAYELEFYRQRVSFAKGGV